jgi:tRNA(Arg) A34 adenosine deaminase TadA
MTSDEKFMKIAIEEAKRGDHPFGAVIVNSAGEILMRAFNTIYRDCDPSAHGEMQAIRYLAAERENGRLESNLTLYTTCEPCPMCMGAIVWAGIDELVIGASIEDLEHTQWRFIKLPCDEIAARAPHPVRIRRGVLRDECIKLYEQ